MKTRIFTLLGIAVITLSIGCQKNIDALQDAGKQTDLQQQKKMPEWTKTVFASGLQSPIGMARAANGWLWVTENVTGNNDGRVTVVDEAGQKYAAIVGFPNNNRPGEGPVGLNHLALRGQTLYILDGGLDGNLYMADISGWKPGDAPLHAADLPKQNISGFTLGVAGRAESNIYNLDFGEDGDLFIADAAGNCIIRRSAINGSLSLFASFGKLPNNADPVPTAIIFDGDGYYVSGLGGFPFTTGMSRIYRVSLSGDVTTHASGFTTLTDIVTTPDRKLLALQFATFVLAPPPNGGYQPNTGRISDASSNTLLGGLMFPTSIVRGRGGNSYFVSSRALGIIYQIN